MSEIRLVPMSAADHEALEEIVRRRNREDNVDPTNTAVLHSLADAYENGITEGEVQAACDWIGGGRPNPNLIHIGRLLDLFRRKSRAAFEMGGVE